MKFCRGQGSNRRSLVLETTALPTEPQPMGCCRLIQYEWRNHSNSRNPIWVEERWKLAPRKLVCFSIKKGKWILHNHCLKSGQPLQPFKYRAYIFVLTVFEKFHGWSGWPLDSILSLSRKVSYKPFESTKNFVSIMPTCLNIFCLYLNWSLKHVSQTTGS